MEPHFPLQYPPLCLTCREPCSRDIGQASNPNGNAGRWFYTCKSGEHEREFSCFDDYHGIANGNPQCWCGFTSRRIRNSGRADTYFFSCPAGSCRFKRNAPLVPGADTVVFVGAPLLYAEARPKVDVGPPLYVEARPKVDVGTQSFEMEPDYNRSSCHCCVVM